MLAGSSPSSPRLDLTRSRYDQTSYWGRAQHFFSVTDPRLALCSDATLDAAEKLVKQYKAGTEPAGTTEEEVWRAKQIYDSAFHPETGEKQLVFGRMSFQVPGNMAITGCMLTFYKSTPAVVFWQWANQSFNAVVNYTNRNASAGLTNQQLGTAYVAATGGALTAALGLNYVVKNSPTLSKSMAGRFVPFVAVAAANCINLPLMRQRELAEGINVQDEAGNIVGKSVPAAQSAITQVVFSRILMAVPGMTLPPLVMSQLEKGAFLKANPWANAPIQILLCGLSLSAATPLACAIFPQMASIPVTSLEPSLRDKVLSQQPKLQSVYFNKGL